MPQFKPIFPNHAIERCTASIYFHPSLPDKSFARVCGNIEKDLTDKGFVKAPGGSGFLFNPATGDVTQAPKHEGPYIFNRVDGFESLLVASNVINFSTSNYVQWNTFIADFKKFIDPLVRTYSDIVDISQIQLEYWDKFIWSGAWDTITFDDLFKKENEIVSPSALGAKQQWHSHCGWFEYFEAKRRLINVKVDVADIQYQGRPGLVPAVGIYTMMRDEIHIPSRVASFDETNYLLTVDELHSRLKILLSGIISESAAREIGLNAESDG